MTSDEPNEFQNQITDLSGLEGAIDILSTPKPVMAAQGIPDHISQILAGYPAVLHPLLVAAYQAPWSAAAWYALASRAQDIQYVGLSDLAAARAALLEPHRGDAVNVMAWSTYNQGRFDEANRLFSRMRATSPRHPSPLVGKSVIAFDLDDVPTAVKAARDAVNLAPDNHEARKALSRALQADGRMPEAWLHWEYRTKSSNHPVRLWLPNKRWDGKALKSGDVLVLCNEDGLGDEIQTLPWIHWVYEQCAIWRAKLVIECDPRLAPSYRATFPGAVIHPVQRYGQAGGMYQRYDHVHPEPTHWLESWSIPHVCKRYLPPFDRREGYLKPVSMDQFASPAGYRFLEENSDKPIFGFAFTTSIMSAIRERYYPPVDEFRRILQIPGTAWVNFQYGETVDPSLADAPNVIGAEELLAHDRTHDISGLLATMRLCSLIVSPRSSVAWMAGAVGVPSLTLRCRPTRFKMGTNHFPGWPLATSVDKTVVEPWGPVIDKAIEKITTMEESK